MIFKRILTERCLCCSGLLVLYSKKVTRAKSGNYKKNQWMQWIEHADKSDQEKCHDMLVIKGVIKGHKTKNYKRSIDSEYDKNIHTNLSKGRLTEAKKRSTDKDYYTNNHKNRSSGASKMHKNIKDRCDNDKDYYNEWYSKKSNAVKKAQQTIKNKKLNDPEGYGKKYKENYSLGRKKAFITMKNDGTYGKSSSKYELAIYNRIKSRYKDAIHQPNFKDFNLLNDYPGVADIYIPSINTVVEIQGDPSHGKEPYDKDSIEHQKLLELYNDKIKEGKTRYSRFIETWTISDPKKRVYCKDNSIRLVEIFNEKDLDEFINDNIFKKSMRFIKELFRSYIKYS